VTFSQALVLHIHHLHLHPSMSIVWLHLHPSTPPYPSSAPPPLPNVLIFSSSHLSKVFELRNTHYLVVIPCGSSKVNMQGGWLFY
jgi:hypothetical protein